MTSPQQPNPPEQHEPRNEIYKLVYARAKLKEFAFESANPLRLLNGLLIKLFRLDVGGCSDDPNVNQLHQFIVDDSQVPAAWMGRIREEIQKIKSLRFGLPIYYYIADPIQHCQTVLAVMHHADGKSCARVHLRVFQARDPASIKLFVEFLTGLNYGKYIWTLNGKKDMIPPPACDTVRVEKLTTEELFALHQQRIEPHSQYIRLTPDLNEMLFLFEDHHDVVRDFHLKRGIFQPLGRAEQARLEQSRSYTNSNQPALLQSNDPVLIELDKIQNKKTSWTGFITILLISILLFVTAGAQSWDKKTLLMLIPILLFHEAGHWLAMKVFKYQNLKMFFIPFFGAAVSGRHYNVPGWKKAVVALAGPVPGILVGAVLGVVGNMTGRPFLNEVALMMLVLNGLNLLPILPMDGGQVMQAILFCRHYLLDAVFRIIAILLIFVASIWIGGRSLMFLGIFLITSLPAAMRIGKITDELRKTGLKTESSDAVTIPPIVASTIADRVKSAAKTAMSPKLIADQTIAIFSNLNARPPGVLASIGLITTYLGSLLFAAIFALFAFLGVTGNFKSVLSMTTHQPTQKLDVREIVTHSVSPTTLPAKKRSLIVANFENHKSAEQASDAIQPLLKNDSATTLAGNTLIVAYPDYAADLRKTYFDFLDVRSHDVHVVREYGGLFRLMCIAPNDQASDEIERELKNYFSTGNALIMQPWNPNDSRTAEQKSVGERARYTYRKLTEAGSIYDDPAMKAINDQIAAESRRGNDETLKSLVEQRQTLSAKLYRQKLDQMQIDLGADADAEVCELTKKRFLESRDWDDEDEENLPATTQQAVDYQRRSEILAQKRKAFQQKIAGYFGPLPMIAGEPDPQASRYTASGIIKREALYIQIGYINFEDAAVGLPALVKWLEAKKCIGFRFDAPKSRASIDDFEP